MICPLCKADPCKCICLCNRKCETCVAKRIAKIEKALEELKQRPDEPDDRFSLLLQSRLR